MPTRYPSRAPLQYEAGVKEKLLVAGLHFSTKGSGDEVGAKGTRESLPACLLLPESAG